MWFYYFFAFMLGACIFSFLNVVAYRLPRKMNYVTDRSICPNCGHTLGGADLVPILGYIFLGGKCRYCRNKISPRYLFVELAGSLLSLFCVLKYGVTLKAAAVFAFICVLTVVAFVDIETMEIPNGFIIAMLAVGVFSYFAFPEITLLERVIGFFCISVPMFVVALATGGFGGGDIKLMAAAGLFFGWKLNCAAAFFGVLFGGICGVYLLAVKKKSGQEQFPFGPSLCLGMFVTLIAGQWLVDYVSRIFIIFE